MYIFQIEDDEKRGYYEKKENFCNAFDDFVECVDNMMERGTSQMGERRGVPGYGMRSHIGQRNHMGYRHNNGGGMYGNRYNGVYEMQGEPWMGEKSGWMVQPVPPMYEQGWY